MERKRFRSFRLGTCIFMGRSGGVRFFLSIYQLGLQRRGMVLLKGLDYLRELNTASVMLRLTLAMFCGGMIGLERARKHRPAGFRTYMLVCMGATLTILLSQYEHFMLTHEWAALAERVRLSGRGDHHRDGAAGGQGPDHRRGTLGLGLYGTGGRRGVL